MGTSLDKLLLFAIAIGFWWLLEQPTQLLASFVALVPTTSGTRRGPLLGGVSTVLLLGNLGWAWECRYGLQNASSVALAPRGRALSIVPEP